MQTPLQLDIWLQSYEGFDNAKNIIKQRNLNTVFANISNTTSPTSDSFLLIMSQMTLCGQTFWMKSKSKNVYKLLLVEHCVPHSFVYNDFTSPTPSPSRFPLRIKARLNRCIWSCLVLGTFLLANLTTDSVNIYSTILMLYHWFYSSYQIKWHNYFHSKQNKFI